MLGKVEQKISDAGVKKKKKKGQTKAGNDCSYYLIQTFLNRNLTRNLSLPFLKWRGEEQLIVCGDI